MISDLLVNPSTKFISIDIFFIISIINLLLLHHILPYFFGDISFTHLSFISFLSINFASLVQVVQCSKKKFLLWNYTPKMLSDFPL